MIKNFALLLPKKRSFRFFFGEAADNNFKVLDLMRKFMAQEQVHHPLMWWEQSHLASR